MRRFREVGRRVERIETNLDVDPDQRIPSVQSSGIPNFTTGFDADPDVRIGDANIPKFADDFVVKMAIGAVEAIVAQAKMASIAHTLAGRR